MPAAFTSLTPADLPYRNPCGELLSLSRADPAFGFDSAPIPEGEG